MAFFCKNGMSNIGPVLSVFTRHARMDVTKVEFSDLHYLSRYIKQFPSWKVFLRDNQSKTLGLVCLLIGIGFIIVFIYCILTKSSIKISLNSYNYTYVTVAHKLNITGYMGPVILPTSYYVYLLQTTFQSICCPDYTSRRCRSKCLTTMYLSSDPLQLLLEFGSSNRLLKTEMEGIKLARRSRLSLWPARGQDWKWKRSIFISLENVRTSLVLILMYLTDTEKRWEREWLREWSSRNLNYWLCRYYN